MADIIYNVERMVADGKTYPFGNFTSGKEMKAAIDEFLSDFPEYSLKNFTYTRSLTNVPFHKQGNPTKHSIED